jgi:predicted Fe-Mo cluster-binding NifX family protein
LRWATEDERGLEAVLSQHLERFHYCVVDIEDKEINEVKAVQNPFYGSHGQPGEVPTFIRSLGTQAIIAGGMGPRAMGFLSSSGFKRLPGPPVC